MSRAKALAPRTALRPPVSISAFQPSGLISGLLLGARPSTKLSITNCIFSLSRQSSCASASAVRLAHSDIAELTGQRAHSVGHRAGVLSEVAGEAGPGGVRHHPAGEGLSGAGEEQVEGGSQI